MIWPKPLVNHRDYVHWRHDGNKKNFHTIGYHGERWHGGGAEAIASICHDVQVEKKREIHVWIPAYFCGQSLRYVRNLPIKIFFYTLTENLLPNYAHLREQSKHTIVDIFVIVHYFGNVAGQKESKAFANIKGAVLVEDCAHVISPMIRKSWVGDYLVFSPHKHFPLPSIGLTLAQKPLRNANTSLNGTFPWKWFLYQTVRRLWKNLPPAVWKQVWNSQSNTLKKENPHRRTKQATIINLVEYSLAAEKRNENAQKLKVLLSKLPHWWELQNSKKETVPYLIGMICKTPELAKGRFEAFNNRSRLVMQWPDLPVEIQSNYELTALCKNKVNKTLFFIVHQRLEINKWTEELNIAIDKISSTNG